MKQCDQLVVRDIITIEDNRGFKYIIRIGDIIYTDMGIIQDGKVVYKFRMMYALRAQLLRDSQVLAVYSHRHRLQCYDIKSAPLKPRLLTGN